MSQVRKTYKKMNSKVIGGFLIMLLLFGTLFANTTQTANATDEFQKLLTYEEIDSLLYSYFSNLNTTEIYNTYNEYYEENNFITNEYYNQTFLNQTFNEYLDLTEVYNQYETNNNYTYLNQTFNEFVTNEYEYINQTFNDVFNDYMYFNQTFNEYVTENYNEFITNNYTYIDYNDFITYNVSEYYITNEYLNQTFNEFVTNEYYEDNYYNTYNEYNQTFLNQTFIDNDYYEYVTNNYINNSLLDSMMTSINDIWAIITSSQDDKVNLEESPQIINLAGQDCSKIEFMIKDSDVLSVYDTLGLGISTQLAQVENIDIQGSFFVDNQLNVVENLFNIEYDKMNNGKYAIEVDETKDLILTSTQDMNLVDSEILMNIAFQKFWEDDKQGVFSIYQDDVLKLEFYQDDDNFYLKDVINNEVVSVSSNNLNNWVGVYENYFKIWKFEIKNNEIVLSIDDVQVLTLNSNPFENSQSNIKFESSKTKGENIYFRSIYINAGSLNILKDEFVLNEEEFEYERNNWLKGEVYIMDDSVLYNIGNNVITKNFENDFNKQDYHLIIDTQRTSISNLYCRD